MKTIIIVCLALVVMASAKYTDKYDNIDFEEIVSNCRLFVPYIKCSLGDRKKCSKQGLELRSHISDALENKCAECTEKQQEITRKVIGILVNTQPKAWELLKAKYDPQNTYVTRFQKELDEVAKGADYSKYEECSLD